MRLRHLALSAPLLLAQCVPSSCTPPPCDEHITWPGRSAVRVLRASAPAQGLIDDGNAVNIGTGTDYVAGHYSTHGSVFAAGPNLTAGVRANYDCREFVVSWTENVDLPARLADHDGSPLQVQYSIDGDTVRVVHLELL